MGLNETLDRLQKEYEKKEAEMKLREEISQLGEKVSSYKIKSRIREYAERIFFERMLKDINNGMSEPKIDALIERSIMIATRFANKLYKNEEQD
ncbi:MAG: hypothetical protein K2M56_09650 [Muribaculaceae bacterium]|nr:hypothetical protein [Muribaculaceae bacterium]